MVTRTVLNGTAVSYVVSWILVTDYALACIPHFVVGHQYYEVYRLMTAMAVNSDFVSLLLAFLTFAPTGNTLENSLGSFVLVWLTLVVFTLGTNVIFTLTCLLLSSISDDSTWKMSSSSGIWTALIGLLALECCLAAKNVPGSSRKLLFWDIPVLYYPLALLALFSLLSGRFQLAYVISVCLGYAIGHELCPWLNLSPSAVKRWEESSIFLNTRFRQQGWVLGPSVMGPAAWSQEASGESRQVRAE